MHIAFGEKMKEKIKPGGAQCFRKPRFSQLVSSALVLFIVAAIARVGVNEHQRWQAKLGETESQLQERSSSLIESESRLRVVEAQLKETRRKLAERKPLWEHLLKPVGLYVQMDSIRFPTGIACTFLPRSANAEGSDLYAEIGPIIFYYADIFHLQTLNSLVDSGKYIHVGSDGLNADWDEDDIGPGNDYYVRKDLIDQYDFGWSSSKPWIENWRNWKRGLRDYCYKKYSSVRSAQDNSTGLRGPY